MELSWFSWRFSAQILLDLTTSQAEEEKPSPETENNSRRGPSRPVEARIRIRLRGDGFELLEQGDLPGMIQLVLRNPAEHVVEGVIVLTLARDRLLEA